MTAPHPFMTELEQQLVTHRGVSASTASNYVRQLAILAGKPFRTLAFLKDYDPIVKKISEYADSTKATVLAAIVSALTLYKDKPTYSGAYNFYYDRMMAQVNANRQKDTSMKSVKQQDNWLTWEEVLKKRGELAKVADEAGKAKVLSPAQWLGALTHLLLSLYTMLPPRRNLDYQEMVVVKKWKDDLPADVNYYDIAGQRFIFNKYKTSKTYGRQEVSIKENPELKSILSNYLKIHPRRKEAVFRLLVSPEGGSLDSANAITRLLNKAFGKKVGSSMLRHIYLSSKYNISEMKKDASEMAHSMDQQRGYLKAETPKNEIVLL